MRDMTLLGCKVAILTVDGFNRRRFFEARARLVEAGAITTVVSSTRNELIRSWHPSNNGCYTAVDRQVGDVHPAYDALFLPGTVADPEAVFVDVQAADFVKSFFDLGRPMVSLCRDRWLFVDRDNILVGRLKPDLPLPSEIQVSPEIQVSSGDPASSADPGESPEELDGVIWKMLAFFEASPVCNFRTMTSRAKSSPMLGAV